MSYEKQTWENLPSQISPFSAERMNHIEEGIKEIDNSLIIAKYRTSGTDYDDPDTTTEALILTNKNTPIVGNFYYIKTMMFGEVADPKPRSQVAIGYDINEMWQRYYKEGTWSGWEKIENNYSVTVSDSKFDDVSDIISDYKELKLYSITNKPTSDGNYIARGASHTVLGMEYGSQQYGSQLSMSFNGVKYRKKDLGEWSDWANAINFIETGEETATNEYIDGALVYKKRISAGALPNATTKTVEHGLTSVNIHKIECRCVNSNGIQFTFSGSGTNPSNLATISSYATSSGLYFHCGSDSSDFNCYVTLYYTKN